jgi:hypothetical protein
MAHCKELRPKVVWPEPRPSAVKPPDPPNTWRPWLVPIIAAVLGLVGVVGVALAVYSGFVHQKEPLVYLMDSTLQMLVYNPDTYRQGGTNGDDIDRLLESLHLRTIKETTSLMWGRQEKVLQNQPDLIIMHASCFYDETNPEDSDHKLDLFLRTLGKTSTKWLIYSRSEAFNDEQATKQFYEQRYPFLIGRLDVLWVDPRTHWSPTVGGILRCKVKKLLDIIPLCE